METGQLYCGKSVKTTRPEHTFPKIIVAFRILTVASFKIRCSGHYLSNSTLPLSPPSRIIWGVSLKSPSNDPQLQRPVDQGHDVSFLNIHLLPELPSLFLHLGQGPGQIIGNPMGRNTY